MHLIELYKSVQGESSFSGLPCIFVRLAGCNLRCAWCDSEYTFTGGEHVSIDQVMNQVRDFGCRLIEVTGGEPLAQAETPALIAALRADGRRVPVFGVTFGDDADRTQLDSLAHMTGGRVFDGTKSLTEAFRAVRGYN